MESTVIALILGAGLVTAMWWTRKQDIAVKWHEWLLGVVGLFSIMFGIWHYFGSAVEGYTFAGAVGLAIFGGLGIILLAVPLVLVQRRQRAAG